MKTKIFWPLLIIAVIIAACAVVIIAIQTQKAPPPPPPPPPPPEAVKRPKDADPEYADTLLRNLAGGMIIFSTKNGGGGKSNFASDISDLKPYIMDKAFCALPGEGQTSYGGYVVKLEEYPAGDAFKTNFRITAYPAEGYVGKTFVIDKSKRPEELHQK